MNSAAAPSNICREPKDAPVSIHNTKGSFGRCIWALSKLLFYFEPCYALDFGTSLSLHGVWAPFEYLTPQNSPLRTTKLFVSKCQFHAYNCFFHLNIIPIYMDSVPYFIREIHFYSCYQSILWSPLKNRMPNNLTIGNFCHPVSKSWLRACLRLFTSSNYLHVGK